MVLGSSRLFGKSEVESVKSLYKSLIRKCALLPKEEIKDYYKNFVRQGFRQHSDETDPARIKQIVAQAKKDSDWILKKFSKMSNELLDFLKPRHKYNNSISYPLFNDYLKFQTDIIDTLDVTIQNVERFYYMASLLLTKPSLVNPKIFSCRVRFVGLPDIIDRRLDHKRLRDNLKVLFDKPIMEADLNFLWSTNVKEVYVAREIILRDERTYDVIEWWQLDTHSVHVLPMHRLLRGDLGLDMKAKSIIYSMHYVVLEYPKFVIDFTCYCPSDHEKIRNFRVRIEDKLVRWAREPHDVLCSRTYIPRSIHLVDSLRYVTVYNQLKECLYQKLKELWIHVGEKTDPEKYIHEDMAIASYIDTATDKLIKNSSKSRTFVDLGCGNGLLTYLLGFLQWRGYGIDIRARKLWKHFSSPNTNLYECAINPFKTIFSNVTRETIFIGNHPDQLTPWIPYMARRTRSMFMIIPCCPYKLDQTKFEKSWGGGSSTYQSYLEYLENLAIACGYRITVDRLRIPSTKRMCLVGTIDYNQPLDQLERSQFWEHILVCQAMNFGGSLQQKVLNCTQVKRADVERIVLKIFTHLLETSKEDDSITDEGFLSEWDRGSQEVSMSFIIKTLLDAEDRKLFKEQAKGIQTLIRNHGRIFQMENGIVRLKVPSVYDLENLKDKSKLRLAPCYFYLNHPQGCPIPEEFCTFEHDPLWCIRHILNPIESP